MHGLVGAPPPSRMAQSGTSTRPTPAAYRERPIWISGVVGPHLGQGLVDDIVITDLGVGVGWSCFHVAMITSPPKIPGFAFSGSSVLTGSPPLPTKRYAPMDTRPRIGGLIEDRRQAHRPPAAASALRRPQAGGRDW